MGADQSFSCDNCSCSREDEEAFSRRQRIDHAPNKSWSNYAGDIQGREVKKGRKTGGLVPIDEHREFGLSDYARSTDKVQYTSNDLKGVNTYPVIVAKPTMDSNDLCTRYRFR